MSADNARKRRYAPPSFAHLRRLTDDTGLLEHALGRIPRRAEGYTTDDNARALWTVTEWLSLGGGVLHAEDRAALTKLAENYMAFLLWNQYDDGWWHNNVAYDRTPEAEKPSGNHDCQGRSIWAVADAWVRLEGALPDTAHIMVQRAMPTLGRIESHRGQAFVMAACAHLIEAHGQGVIRLPGTWREEMTVHMERYERIMNDAFRRFSDESWRWFEPAMTYSNGLVPWAMLRTYRVTGCGETLRNGLDGLSFLVDSMTAEEGWLRPIGNDGWGTPDSVSRWDQQPLEMFKLALALEEAAIAVEHADRAELAEEPEALAISAAAAYARRSGGKPVSPQRGGYRAAGAGFGTQSVRITAQLRDVRDLCLSWFYGDNDKRQPMCDPRDGSCCDGLMEAGPNINCGAESTLSYLMTEAICRRA